LRGDALQRIFVHIFLVSHNPSMQPFFRCQRRYGRRNHAVAKNTAASSISENITGPYQREFIFSRRDR